MSLRSIYQVGGWFEIDSMSYSSFDSMASELSTGYGYAINGSSACTFLACGGEQNAKGAFYLSSGSNNLVFTSPYGASNNTSADASIGDLFEIDSTGGACAGITIVNPVSESPNAATTSNVYANTGNGLVDVLGVTASHLSKGIGGDATWIATKLTRTGDGEVQSWTPVLAAWTNVGSPTIIGKYVKKGNLVNFYVTITPATSISCTKSTSSITGLPFSPIGGVAAMVDGNVNSYGAVAVGSTGIVYPQTSGVVTTTITISGSFMI
jgi:hypothetical protein